MCRRDAGVSLAWAHFGHHCFIVCSLRWFLRCVFLYKKNVYNEGIVIQSERLNSIEKFSKYTYTNVDDDKQEVSFQTGTDNRLQL